MRDWLLGPVEGWILVYNDTVGVVKGCEHPLPSLHYVPRLVGGQRLSSKNPLDMCSFVECRPSPCIGGHPAPLAVQGYLVNPLDTITKVYGCHTRVCRAARKLLEYIESAGVDLVGFTGSLAYDTNAARDIDIVVYGLAGGYRVYSLLRDLREDGVTKPLAKPDTQWERGIAETAKNRLLVGIVDGATYSIRIVKCLRPTTCPPTVVEGWGRLCGTLEHLDPPWLTPTYYLLRTSSGGVLVYTLRLRYTELPRMKACVEGFVENVCGLKRIVPDRGGRVVLVGVD